MADLRDEPMPRWPEARPEVVGHPVGDYHEVLELVRLRRLVAVLPESADANLPPGLVSRPVPDADPVTLVLAWSRTSTSPTVAGFVRAALAA